jgi:hypothetical protein
LAGLLLAAAPVSAQTVATTTITPSDKLCFVFTVDGTVSGTKELRASCGGRGIILGGTTGYRVFENHALKAIVIENNLDAQRRIVVIRLEADGQPMVEDITSDLALAAGRGVMSNLRGLDINLEGFAADGAVGVGPAAGDATNDKSGIVNIGQRIADARAGQGAATQN